jgi:hypothetical protein
MDAIHKTQYPLARLLISDFEIRMAPLNPRWKCGMKCEGVRANRWWAGRDNASLTEPTSSQETCLKTRREASHQSGAPTQEGRLHVSRKKQERNGSILQMADA